jgi:TRAP-type C4-dicarboxylate transport system permease large subunit
MPIIRNYGLSPIWLGVWMSMACAVGFTTPPVAVNLYPAARIAGINLETISKGIIPFVFAGLVACVLVIIFPDIVMWLPRFTGLIKS